MFGNIGLKAKILLGLSTLLVMAIVGGLLFTNYLLVSDKKAYIFENVLASAEEVRNLLNENIQDSLFRAESLVLLRHQDHELKTLIDRQELVDGLFFIVGKGERQSVMKSSFPESGENYPAFVANWIKEASPSEAFGIQVSKLQDKNVLAVNFRDQQKVLGFLINMKNLWARISSDLVFSYVIVDQNKNVLWSSAAELTELPWEELSHGTVASQAREMELAGTTHLVGISSLPELGLQVVSFISTAKAYAVVGDLSVKIIALGLVLLGISLIIGLIFSSRLTGPLKALMEGAEYVAQGDFSHQVEVKSKDELFVLADRFNYMSGQIKDLLENLEKKVEERTRELKAANDFIQTMIDSLNQGLFVIDRELKCSPVYTRACEELFQKSLKGQSFEEVLELSEEEKTHTEKWADILFSEMLPFDSAAQLGIKEKTYGDSVEHEDYRFLNLTYHPMRDEEERISNLVVVATDKTAEKRAMEEVRKKERYVEMIFKIISSKKQFIDFIHEVENYLQSLDEVFEEEVPNLDQAMLVYHSFNGGFGMYAVDSLVSEARKCEQTIVDMKKSGELELDILLKEKESFKQSYEDFKKHIFETLKFQRNTFEVDQAILLYVNDLIQERGDYELKYVFSEQIMKVPVEEFFLPYKHLLETLGPKLGKEFAPLKINSAEIRVDPEKFREFFSLMVHLFRNCADHGIEAPQVREERNKSLAGAIQVHVAKEAEGKRLRIVLEDDGGGIDPQRIRSKLMEKTPDKSYEEESDQEIIYHIFDQDFSTAEQVTAISGRGVGMSAIKEIVERMEGEIKVESEVGVGTKFIFFLPLSS
ncbi:MAG: ATP-binding protein [Bacteriovoracaceae bacterium]|nr:ATP-binding protein [Bacteriovoracaceae bacterium]